MGEMCSLRSSCTSYLSSPLYDLRTLAIFNRVFSFVTIATPPNRFERLAMEVCFDADDIRSAPDWRSRSTFLKRFWTVEANANRRRFDRQSILMGSAFVRFYRVG